GTRYLVRRELLRGSGPRDRIVSIDVQVLLFDSYSFVSVHLLRRPAGFELIGTAYKLDSWRPISPRRRRRASGSSTSTDRPKGARRLTAAWSAGKSRTTTPLPSRSTIWSPTRRANGPEASASTRTFTRRWPGPEALKRPTWEAHSARRSKPAGRWNVSSEISASSIRETR